MNLVESKVLVPSSASTFGLRPEQSIPPWDVIDPKISIDNVLKESRWKILMIYHEMLSSVGRQRISRHFPWRAFLKNRTFYIVLNRDTPKKIDKYLWELFNVLHKIRMENPIETFGQNQMLMGTEELRRWDLPSHHQHRGITGVERWRWWECHMEWQCSWTCWYGWR